LNRSFTIFLKLIAVFMIIICLTGCWNRRELDSLSVLVGIGIDKTDEPQKVNVTAQIAIPSKIKTSGNKDESSSSAYWNIQYKAENVFTALRESTFSASRKLYIGQNPIVLFGEDLARDGVQKHIDFFLRDHEARLNEYIVIAKGKAGAILNVKPELEKLPGLNIEKLIDLHYATSKVISARLMDFVSSLASGTTSPVAPMIQVDGASENQKLSMSGTAVFKNDKLTGELDMVQTRGYLWVVDKVKGGLINTKTPNGVICLEILHSKSKMTAKKKEDGSFVIKIAINADINAGNQEEAYNLLLPENISYVENQASDTIKSEIKASLNKAWELKADIFGFGEAIKRKDYKKWESIKDDWDNIFPEIETELEVAVKLRGTGEINKFVQPEPEKREKNNGA